MLYRYNGSDETMKLSFSLKTTTLIAFLIISTFTATATGTAKAATSTDWGLVINGLVQHPLNLTIDDLKAMPQTTEEATIFCVDFPNQIVTTGIWTGVTLVALLQQAGVQPSAVKVAFFATDQYATDLNLVSALDPAVIVAYAKDGAPLSETLRLVVPGRWGYKWISQLTTITLMDYDFKGKWESQGYSDDANMQSTGSTPGFQNTQTYINPSQSNASVLPSSNPPAINSTTTAPSQGTQNSKPELEPKTPNTTSYLPEISAAAFAALIVLLLVFVAIRRHHRNPKTSNT
jgi:hypothetical protein